MKAYFTTSIYFKKQRSDSLNKIINTLVGEKVEVQFDHIMNVSMDDISAITYQASISYYKKVKKWISSSDIVVAEISFPSTINVGHEITLALELSKPVLAFYEKGSEVVFLSGIEDENFFYIEYENRNIINVLKRSLKYVAERQLKRFNLMLEPSMINFLNKRSKETKIPKSQILRSLILNEMKIEDKSP